VLSAAIPDGERIITVEDAAELQLSQEHVITLETRPPTSRGKGQVTIRDLVRNTLRMRPRPHHRRRVSRPETVDMLQAMNTGHDGSLTTIHANTPRDALSRVETLVLTGGVDLPLRAIREQIVGRLRPDRPGLPPRRRLAPHHAHHRGAAHGVGRRDDAGHLHRRSRVEDTEEIAHAGSRLLGPLLATGIKPQFLHKLSSNGVKLPPVLPARARATERRRRHGRPPSAGAQA
jgi:pilus assembly protein CpaF